MGDGKSKGGANLYCPWCASYDGALGIGDFQRRQWSEQGAAQLVVETQEVALNRHV